MKKNILYLMLFTACLLSAQSSIVTDSVYTEYIPYGVRTKYSQVASTSVAKGKELSSVSTPTLVQSLYGILPGVLINQSSAEPGDENTDLFIRGRSSLMENIPLILVDGIETSYQQINWSEVDKITVLKDAPGLAIYGMRGANGVVLINTVRGAVTGKPVITLNARHGFQTPLVMPEFTSTATYMERHNEARINDGLSPVYSEERISGTRSNVDPYLYPDINWRDEVLKTYAPVSDYTLTFRGGSSAVRYFLMLGYLNNQGFYKDTDPRRDNNSNLHFDRYSFRSNLDISVTKEFTVSLDLSGRIFQKSQPNINTDDHWRSMNRISFFPVQTPDGLWAGRQGEITNPKAAVLEGGFRSYHSRELNETLRLHYDLSELVPGLGVFGTAAFSSWFKTNYDKTKQYPFYEVNLRPGTTPGTDDVAYDYVMRGNFGDRTISQGTYWQWNRFNLEGGFDYRRTLGEHDLSGMLIYHQNLYRARGVHTPFAQQRYMTRLHYGYKNTYFAEFASSLSGSDNFEPSKRFGFFPSAGLAWVMSNEDFLSESEAISFLKIKLSSGRIGSDRLGSTGRWGYQQYYSYGSGITIGGEITNGLANLMEGSLGNPGLTWEKAQLTNFSLEAEFLKKLHLQVDMFRENRRDILVPASGTRPSYIGVALPFVNEGETQNQGIELALTLADKSNKFEYWLGGNISFIRSKVISKNEEPRKDDYRWETGHPVGTIFGLEAIGFFSDNQDISQSPTQLFGTNKPGDIKYRDLNGDNVIDELDMKPIGKSVTPELIYGINGGIKAGSFDLSFIVQGIGNRSVLLSGNMVKPFIDNARITPWAAEGRWTPENANEATYPRLSTLDNSNNYQPSTFWIRNGSYLRLKNIEIGYTLPASALMMFKIQQCRLFVNGNNLFTVQHFSDIAIDPESMTINTYPLVKTMNVGVNVSF